MEGITNLKPSLALRELGVDKWLAERECQECEGYYETHSKVWGDDCPACHGSGKQPLWPALVWRIVRSEGWEIDLFEESDTHFPDLEYVHALPLTVALAFMEECYEERVWFDSISDPAWGSHRAGQSTPEVLAFTESELLDKMLAMDVKP